MALRTKAILLCLVAVATIVSAKHGPGRGRPGPDDDDDDWSDWEDGPFPGRYGGFDGGPRAMSRRRAMVIAHGVLAALAFVIFFPIGAILIRLGSFRLNWLIHGIFQLFAYAVFTAAFGLGIWMVIDFPGDLIDMYHPIIGIVVFVLLFFQPILGFIHHIKFRKYRRRTIWSHGHLWLGRIVITLGMINGGLGLLLASDAPRFTGFAPSRGQIIAYGVVAGFMWLAWVAAAVIGERKRSRALKHAQREKQIETNRESFDERGLNKGTGPADQKANEGGKIYA